MADITERLEKIRSDFESAMKEAVGSVEIENIRIRFLGKKSEILDVLKMLRDLDINERKAVGAKANELRENFEQILRETIENLKNKDVSNILQKSQKFDITLPGKFEKFGSYHPVTIVQRELEQIFTSMGFSIVDGPEVEHEYYNFIALNIPANHPARDMQDTYWCDNGQVLRTHTSPCQVRGMEKFGAPLRIVAPGRCFRCESIDASHENTFFQFEGMMIDTDVTIANLIYVMRTLLEEFFKRSVTVRLRPGYFPFVEPGFELDIKCMICDGAGCPTCKNSGWVELLPCGMVHPNVLKYGNIDPDKYRGFAFGLGLTRLVMMRYGIKDIRVLNSGDLRAMSQFAD